MAFDAYLKIDGIKGESQDAKHKGEIDLSSFSWGLSQTGTYATGGGGGAGKVHMHDIVFYKKTDASSPLLMLNCANGAHIKEATLTVRKAGGTQLEFLKIKLNDVLVSSYKPFGSQNGGDPVNQTVPGQDDWELSTAAMPQLDEIPQESFSLNFSKIEVSYQAQGADGKAAGGPVVAGWDVKANVKV